MMCYLAFTQHANCSIQTTISGYNLDTIQRCTLWPSIALAPQALACQHPLKGRLPYGNVTKLWTLSKYKNSLFFIHLNVGWCRWCDVQFPNDGFNLPTQGSHRPPIGHFFNIGQTHLCCRFYIILKAFWNIKVFLRAEMSQIEGKIV